MTSNRKLFGKTYTHISRDEVHILCWVKKKRGKRWKIMYVACVHKKGSMI